MTVEAPDTAQSTAVAAITRRRWSHTLFGYDVFISYTRRDSRAYANAVALKLHSEIDLVVFLDDEEFDIGERLPTLLRAARRSRMLVVLASPQVSSSRFVPKESCRGAGERTPHRADRPRGHARERTGRRRTLEGAARGEVGEETNALDAGPSQNILNAIARSRHGLRRRVQQRLFFVFIIVALLALSGYAFRLAGQREAALRAETLRAEQGRHLAYASQLLLACELPPREPVRAGSSRRCRPMPARSARRHTKPHRRSVPARAVERAGRVGAAALDRLHSGRTSVDRRPRRPPADDVEGFLRRPDARHDWRQAAVFRSADGKTLLLTRIGTGGAMVCTSRTRSSGTTSWSCR